MGFVSSTTKCLRRSHEVYLSLLAANNVMNADVPPMLNTQESSRGHPLQGKKTDVAKVCSLGGSFVTRMNSQYADRSKLSMGVVATTQSGQENSGHL